jgi:energy-coupling factor transport system permease protein
VIRLGSAGQMRPMALVEASPLRHADPRAKLALGLAASLAVMLPLEKLVVFMGAYLLLLACTRLLPEAARQVWRLKWVLVLLFILDWLVVSLELAAVVTLRLVLLSGSFALLFSTTTPGELCLALEWMHVPYRYAFSVGLAFQSLGLLDDEWRSIREAQRARGAWRQVSGWRNLIRRLGDMVALAVPAVVMTTKRAWAMTEAAYARGFDSPHRKPFRKLHMRWSDWLLLAAAAAVICGVVLWRWGT